MRALTHDYASSLRAPPFALFTTHAPLASSVMTRHELRSARAFSRAATRSTSDATTSAVGGCGGGAGIGDGTDGGSGAYENEFFESVRGMWHDGLSGAGKVTTWEIFGGRMARGELPTLPIAFSSIFASLLLSQLVDPDGTFRTLSMLECVWFPRFQVSQRVSRKDGCSVAVAFSFKAAFEDFLETDDLGSVLPDLDFLSDDEAAGVLAAKWIERMPPIALGGGRSLAGVGTRVSGTSHAGRAGGRALLPVLSQRTHGRHGRHVPGTQASLFAGE